MQGNGFWSEGSTRGRLPQVEETKAWRYKEHGGLREGGLGHKVLWFELTWPEMWTLPLGFNISSLIRFTFQEIRVTLALGAFACCWNLASCCLDLYGFSFAWWISRDSVLSPTGLSFVSWPRHCFSIPFQRGLGKAAKLKLLLTIYARPLYLEEKIELFCTPHRWSWITTGRLQSAR